MFGRQCRLLLTAKLLLHLHWMPFFQCACSWKMCCEKLVNFSRLHLIFTSVCMLIMKLKVQFCVQWKRFEEWAQNLTLYVGGPSHPCGFTSVGSLYCKMWVGLNGFDPRNNLVLSGVRIGMGCMNLVIVISRYTWVPNRTCLKIKLHCVTEYSSFRRCCLAGGLQHRSKLS